MLWILLGVVSLLWCIHSAIVSSSDEGTHRAQWSGKGGGKTGAPTFIQALWFFVSIVVIIYGYVEMATS